MELPETLACARIGESAQASRPLSAMARFPQSFKNIVGADSSFVAWEARRRREEELTVVVRRFLPRPLAMRIRVADARYEQLELVTEAGAIAATARQRSAELLTHLKRQGWEFTGIRIRVQVATPAAARRKLLVNPLDREALQPLGRLARDLPSGPLKASLERFLRRVG